MYSCAGDVILSPSDLNGFLACRHLTELDRLVAAGKLDRPVGDRAEAAVLSRRGEEHERRELARLEGEGLEVVRVPPPGPGPEALAAAEAVTVDAMRAGAEVIYQASFFDGRWRGCADFLRRVAAPTGLGGWGYEVADAKLARRATSDALLQLCNYSEHVARIQGCWPRRMEVVTGDGDRQWVPVVDVLSYYRAAKRRLEDAVDGPPLELYPDPVAHCGRCPWGSECSRRRRDDDHLSLVAGMRSDSRVKLGRSGVTTVAQLATHPVGVPVRGMGQATLERLIHQARLQLRQRADGQVHYEVLPAGGEMRGLALLPPPSPGDLFFDIEGDPWHGSGGLEYLWGVVGRAAAGEPSAYTALWAHDPHSEKAAFEAFVDRVMAGLEADPGMHVYHYAPYEVTALRKLMGRYASREAEVDRLLRGEVLVDLYRVVRHGVRISQEGYGLKKLEPLFLGSRQGDITDGGSSIVAYERWLETGDASILESLRAYNEIDCRATEALRDWLEQRRLELAARAGQEPPRPARRDGVPSAALAEAEAATESLAARLVAGVPDDPDRRSPEASAAWLLAQLLAWHRREAKPEWWAWYDRLVRSDEELLDDHHSVAFLRAEGPVAQVARSTVHRYRHPVQEHALSVGDHPIDPATGSPAGEVWAVDVVSGTIDLKRGRSSPAPHPSALVPQPPFDTLVLRRAVARVAAAVAEHGIGAGAPYRAVTDLLAGRPPAVAGHAAGHPLRREGEEPLAAARRIVPRLAGGCLPVQGPPGSGKTFAGAALVVDAVRRGQRVGVTGPSHKAITNLVEAVCRRSKAVGLPVRVLQCSPEESRASADQVGPVAAGDVEQALAVSDADVVAGTSWLFAREELAGSLDLLVVDEAGQSSLANVVAVAGSARDMVLLGDPQQLGQPSRGVHPTGAEASALGHVLGERSTVPPSRGLFLHRSFRMHPDICRFVSEMAYDGQLEADASCEKQLVGEGPLLAGAGLRWLPGAHHGNRIRSEEEVAAVVAAVSALLGRPFTDHHGEQRPLAVDDVLVIAPFNAHVARLAAALPAGARVGTVERFQGQEAPVVVYSMAASSADDAGRGIDFLCSLNRLNVAVSRARALAVLVCSPALLESRCRRPGQLRLVNALCRFVELATPVPWP